MKNMSTLLAYFVSEECQEILKLERNSVCEITAIYRSPTKKRDSKLRFFVHIGLPNPVTNSIGSIQITPGVTLETVPTASGGQTNYLLIESRMFNKYLSETLLGNVLATQHPSIYYERIEVRVLGPFGEINENGKVEKVETIPTNLNLPVINTYRLKSGLECEGRNKTYDSMSPLALVLRTYPRTSEIGMPDKPARLLILGSVYQSRGEAVSDGIVKSLTGSLVKGYSFESNNVNAKNIVLTPVHFIGNTFQKGVISQLEGLQAVAGSYLRAGKESTKLGGEA